MKHSKFTAIVLALCMLVTLLVVPAAAAENVALVPDGSFETGDLTGWEPNFSGVSPTVKEDASGNHYVEFDMNAENTITHEGIKCQLQGLTPGKKYAIHFDVCTSGPFFLLDGAGSDLTSEDPGIGGVFDSMSTSGEWQGHGYEWVQPADKTTLWVRFALWGNTGFVQGEDYVRVDNISVMEVDTKNLIVNGSFEYGPDGLGYKNNSNGFNAGAFGSYNFTSTDVYTQVTGGVDGKYAMQISRPAESTSDWNGLRKQASSPQYQYTVEIGSTYVYTAYVKNISLVDVDGKAFTLVATGPDMGDGVNYSAADLPVGEWVCISFVKTHTAAPVFDVRVYGTGTVLIDNLSCYKLDRAFVTYANAAGHYSTSLVDGGKATITMPVAEGDAGNIVALAVYSEVEGKKTLKSLTTKMIVAGDITTAGYIRFTLTADKLNDFATANYTAKLMSLKNGVLVPLQDVVLYTEAQEA